jgi:hypothetical protein
VNVPIPDVAAVRLKWVLWFTTPTSEDAMTEPLWSTTVPLMDPSTVWPITGRAAKNNAAANMDTRFKWA